MADKERPVSRAQGTSRSKGEWQSESQDQEWNQIWDLEAVWCSPLPSTSSLPPPKPCPSHGPQMSCYGCPRGFRLRCQKPLERHDKVLPGGLSWNHNGSICVNSHFFLRKRNGEIRWECSALTTWNVWNPGVKTSNAEWPLIFKKLEILSLPAEKLRNHSLLPTGGPHNGAKAAKSAADRAPECQTSSGSDPELFKRHSLCSSLKSQVWVWVLSLVPVGGVQQAHATSHGLPCSVTAFRRPSF